MQEIELVTEKLYIAVDLGADSGRVMLGIVSADPSPKADKLQLEEVHRFSNGPIEQDGSLHWDFARLMSETKTGISKAAKQAKGKVAGIGVDSWGVDFGLLDENGNLTENPYHYRDRRTNGIMEKAFELMPKREIYEHTGIQFMQLNSVYQLLSMRLSDSPVLKKAKKLILIANLVSYLLSGKLYAEYTLASSSQLMDMRTGKWSRAVFNKLNLPIEIMPDVIQPGKVVGKLTKKIACEIGCSMIPVIAVASHDSASAVAAIPASPDSHQASRGGPADQNSNWAYISSGTWSVIGAQTPGPIINDKTFSHQFTNEGGVEGTIRLLKNIMGLWLVQECRRQWQKDGQDLSYAQLTAMAQNAKPFAATVDVNSSVFLAPGDMPKRINEHLDQTGQQQIKDKGQMVRVLLECFALKYRQTMEQLEEVTGSSFDRLHIVGGGSQNELLNQLTANATGRTVIAGPVEAAAIGNILMQAMATGQIKNIAQGKQLVRNSFPLKQYQPTETALWQQRYDKTKS
jgi:sugar (pentulose or hexulose) kinase